ncbi:MAG: ankyrin repeat domain-containing protein [Saprospiraceae bacterium]
MLNWIFRNKRISWAGKPSIEHYNALKDGLVTGELSLIEQLVNDGLNINATEGYGNENILSFFILNHRDLKMDSIKFLKLCVKNHINLDHVGNKRTQQMAPLHLSVISNSILITEYLIETGATVDLQDKNENTPLWKGVMNYRGDEGIKTILELLITHGASLDTKNYHGRSPRDMILSIQGGIEAGHNNQEWNLMNLLK